MAAIEAAMALKDALRRGGHRVDSANPDSRKTNIKFDRRTIAVSKVEETGPIYSDDDDIHKLAAHSGLAAFRTADINSGIMTSGKYRVNHIINYIELVRIHIVVI